VLLGTKSRVVSSRQVATCKLRYTLPEPVLAIYGMRDPNESMSAMAIWTKPLARRTLPRVRRPAVVEGLR